MGDKQKAIEYFEKLMKKPIREGESFAKFYYYDLAIEALKEEIRLKKITTLANYFEKVKRLIVKTTNIDVYCYKHGEFIGVKTIRYLGLFSKLKPFYNFDIQNGDVVIYDTTDINTKYEVHSDCD